MRVALSFDMEGVSQITDVRETLACFEEYWDSGREKLHADVVAAAEGLLAGGATDVVLLDNHGSGNPGNLEGLPLPEGARLESWHLFDLHEHGVDAQLQVGYHARGGVDGFLSHSYVPGLRLRVGEEPVSESHGRAWGGDVPLVGIVGNDLHERTLGLLAGTPYLVVQESDGRSRAKPRFEARETSARIRAFARDALRDPPPAQRPPSLELHASLSNGVTVAPLMEEAGWHRVTERAFEAQLADWSDARGLIDGAMRAALAPFLPSWSNGLSSKDAIREHDADQMAGLRRAILQWAAATEPEWYD